MKIVIPTYGRPEGKLDVLENGWIPESFYKRVYVCIRRDVSEMERYKNITVDYPGVNLVLIDVPKDSGIPEKRDAICRHWMFENQKIWMMDDDIKIVPCHITDEKDYVIKEKELSEESFYDLINYSIGLLNDMPFGVIATATFVKGKDIFPIGLNRWGAFSSFINLEKLSADDLGYTKVRYYEDVAAFCGAINKGFNNFYITKWQLVIGKEKEGGNVAARHADVMQEAAYELNKLYPKHIKLVNMKDKTHDRKINLKVQPTGVPKHLKDLENNSVQITDFMI
tara:strand:- start:523 stop:1368 length:846 start_codon:yes stop_codon:yes gene_type:complete